MTDNDSILTAIEKVIESGKQAALATVVSVQGSAYRKEGAKMLVDEDGRFFGMISGGCLEPNIVEIAKEVIKSGQSLLKTFDLDEDLVWGLGLGCPGKVKIYIEPLNQSFPLELWLTTVKEKREGILATILPSSECSFNNKEAKRLFISKNNELIGHLACNELNEQVEKVARRKMGETNPKSETRLFHQSNGKETNVFIDVYIPPSELMIFGASHDAIPLVKYAVSLGFKTIVVDQREAYNDERRFPNVLRLLLSTSEFAKDLKIGPRTYVVVMNHHFERDQETLKFVLHSASPYIGALGPRFRRIRIMNGLKQEGIEFTAKQLKRLYSPVGLNIGAETPEEIAISILGEIIAIKNGHSGGFLHDSDTIHAKTNRLGEIG